MRYVVGFFVGLVLGIVAAVTVVYFNPLTRRDAGPVDETSWSLTYSLSAPSTFLSTHDSRVGVPLVPPDVPMLWERGIKGMLLAAMPLRGDETSESVLATRVSIPSASTELLKAGVVIDDFWLISVPGRGSILVHSMNNQWPLLRDTVIRVDWLGRDWSGDGEYSPTAGPGPNSASVVGLTGEYARARGRGWERLVIDEYRGNFATLSGELLLDVAQAAL